MMKVPRIARSPYGAAFILLLSGSVLGWCVRGSFDVESSHGFCDVVQRVGKGSSYPIEVANREFVASVDEDGPTGISFPPCGRALLLDESREGSFKRFLEKARAKRNTIFVGGVVSGTIDWSPPLGAPIFRILAVNNLQEADKPSTLP